MTFPIPAFRSSFWYLCSKRVPPRTSVLKTSKSFCWILSIIVFQFLQNFLLRSLQEFVLSIFQEFILGIFLELLLEILQEYLLQINQEFLLKTLHMLLKGALLVMLRKLNWSDAGISGSPTSDIYCWRGVFYEGCKPHKWNTVLTIKRELQAILKIAQPQS